MKPICCENVILVGFSGTGKSLAGKQIAHLLGWTLVDMDSELERRAGKSIARIFAEDGEVTFRALEKDLLKEVCSAKRQIISTGGGVVLDEENRSLILENGVVICLNALPETIYRRLLGDGENPGTERPLLASPDALERIRKLKADRQTHYSIAHCTLDTDDLTIEEVASWVVSSWERMAAPPPEKAN